MARALWNNVVIAESDRFELVENNVYFPPDAIKREYFISSDTTSVCGWKGTAHYYSVIVNGKENKDAAWYYSDPKPAARQIKDHIAFWRGVTIEN